MYVYKPDHPFAGKQGYIAEHRLVMERVIGRYLKSEEAVHHINRARKDNRPENLQLFASHGLHTKHAHPEVAEKSRKLLHGKRLSPRTEFKKGMTPWNKHKKWSEEVKDKVRRTKLKYYESHAGYWLGKKKPKVVVEAMQQRMMGRHLSPKTEWKKGAIPWNKGKHFSEESRRKMSEAAKRRWQKPAMSSDALPS